MHIRCSQEHLARAVSTVSRAISSRATMPILGNVLLETTNDGLKLAATDLEVGIQTVIPARVERGGHITLPARLLTEITNSLPPEEVEMAVAEGSTQAQIRCMTAQFEILGLPAEDFPRIPEPQGEAAATLDADLARTMIRQTIFAVSTDETRPFLTGLYVVLDGAEARMVATDGGRLALRTSRLETPAHKKIAEIVPAKAMHELSRILGAAEGDVGIYLEEKQLIFDLPPLRLFTRLIAGTFPNYQQVIPKEFKQRIQVDTETLLHAVRRVAITARDSANVVRIETQDGSLVISSNTPEVGNAREEVEVEAEGERIQTAFNAKFLMDALNNIDAGQVVVQLTGPLSPGAVRPVGSEEYTYVLAPVRVYT